MTRKLALIIGFVACSAAVVAGPISNCTNNIGSPGYTCNIYETNSLGNASDITNIISLPSGVTATAGEVLLLDAGGSLADPTTWSDLIVFTSNTVQLFSVGCNIANGDTSCFPSGTITQHFFETIPAPTQFGWGNGTINIFSDESDEQPIHNGVPEPATFGMLGAGLAGLFFARKRIAR